MIHIYNQPQKYEFFLSLQTFLAKIFSFLFFLFFICTFAPNLK